jgi:hypothetical protein
VSVIRTRSALALAGICGAVLGTVVAGVPRANADHPSKPHRIGPIVTVMSGPNWSLVAWQSDRGLCYSYGAPGQQGDGCGISLRRTIVILQIGAVPSVTFRRNAATLSIGMTRAAVAAVTLTVSGATTSASIYKAPRALRIRSRFFAVKGPPLQPFQVQPIILERRSVPTTTEDGWSGTLPSKRTPVRSTCSSESASAVPARTFTRCTASSRVP